MACLYEYDDTNVNPQQVMQREMYNIYAKAVENLLFDVVQEECHGCQIDHPSQKQHDVCLFMTYEQQVDCFQDDILDDILKRLDFVEIIKDWVKAVGRLYPGSNVYDLITDSFHRETCDLNSKQGLGRLNSLIKQRRKDK